jgi:hypothetical protein
MTDEPWLTPASFAQERIWIAGQLDPDSTVYNVPAWLPLPTSSVPAAIAALQQVVQRHEILRTALQVGADGELRQAVYRELAGGLEHLAVDVLDLRELSGPDREREITGRSRQLAAEPFRLDQPPLWRAQLAYVPDGLLLLFVGHHTIYDAPSLTNLKQELSELLTASQEHREPKLPDLPIQYADYAAWERSQHAEGAMATDIAYWRERLAGAPASHRVPTDRPRPRSVSYAGGAVHLSLAEFVPAVDELARRAAATPAMVLLAAYQAVLARLSGTGDVVVGMPLSQRPLPELQPVLGTFVNVLVLRTRLGDDDLTFEQLLLRVRETMLEALEHQGVPFQKLVEVLAPPRVPGAAPFYQLGFDFVPLIAEDDHDISVADLTFETSGTVSRLEYRADLFDRETVEQIGDQLVSFLADALAAPGKRLAELGKPVTTAVNTAALAEQSVEPPGEQSGIGLGGPPQGDAEELVASTFASVLDVTAIRRGDDFFDLGGHSLLATKVAARLSAVLDTHVPIRLLFDHPTVATFAGAIEELLTAELEGPQ